MDLKFHLTLNIARVGQIYPPPPLPVGLIDVLASILFKLCGSILRLSSSSQI